jgi:hypothetical protein
VSSSRSVPKRLKTPKVVVDFNIELAKKLFDNNLGCSWIVETKYFTTPELSVAVLRNFKLFNNIYLFKVNVEHYQLAFDNQLKSNKTMVALGLEDIQFNVISEIVQAIPPAVKKISVERLDNQSLALLYTALKNRAGSIRQLKSEKKTIDQEYIIVICGDSISRKWKDIFETYNSTILAAIDGAAPAASLSPSPSPPPLPTARIASSSTSTTKVKKHHKKTIRSVTPTPTAAIISNYIPASASSPALRRSTSDDTSTHKRVFQVLTDDSESSDRKKQNTQTETNEFEATLNDLHMASSVNDRQSHIVNDKDDADPFLSMLSASAISYSPYLIGTRSANLLPEALSLHEGENGLFQMK